MSYRRNISLYMLNSIKIHIGSGD